MSRKQCTIVVAGLLSNNNSPQDAEDAGLYEQFIRDVIALTNQPKYEQLLLVVTT